MAESIGEVVGTVLAVILLIAPFALLALLIVLLVRRSRRKMAKHLAEAARASAATTPTAPPGWYSDIERPGGTRWWDGAAWAPREAMAPTQPPAHVEEPAEFTHSNARIAEQRSGEEPQSRMPTAVAATPGSEAIQPEPSATPAAGSPIDGDRIKGAQWIAAGHPVTVGDYTIPGGLIYLGRALAAPQRGIEPSLINPKLRVDNRNPDTLGSGLGYWSCYDELSPQTRAGYLEWLSNGRRIPTTPLGYVFLFMYGLEHRVLVDIQANKSLHHELSSIRAEMLALIAVYGEKNYSFDNYSRQFVDAIDLLISAGRDTPPGKTPPPPLTGSRWNVPIQLRVELGAFAIAKVPIPAEWAAAWAWHSPDFRIRTAATRCTAEFATLFAAYYSDQFGDGMRVTPGKRTIEMTYYAASSGIGYAKLGLNSIPDVFAQSKPNRALVAIAENTQESLESFSRYVGKNPDGRDTLRGIALLPDRLVRSSTNADLAALREWLSTKLEASSQVSVTGQEVLAHWQHGVSALTKAETTPLIQLLDALGVGIEPDVRFGGPAIVGDAPAVLFTLPDQSAQSASPGYETATTLTHLAAAVSASDGQVSDSEVQTFLPSIESTLDLTPQEKVRLSAHFTWLAAAPTKLTGLTKRIATLTNSQRTDLGSLLVSVAAADGVVTPQEMSALTKIFGLLGLDQNGIASQAFAAQSSQKPPAVEPITVRVAEPSRPGVPVPPRTRIEDAPSGGVVLDQATIARTMAESAGVSELLRNIFDEGVVDHPRHGRRSATIPESSTGAAPAALEPQMSQTPGPQTVAVSGLDPQHSAIVRQLAGLASISLGDFEEMAQAMNLMPIGAIDTINEAAFDASDEPLLEGDDTLSINSHALEEMLR